MADVPDQPVVRCVEHVVQGHGQFDDPKPGAEVAARYRDRADCLTAEFVGNFLKIFLVDAAKIGRRPDRVQNGRSRRHACDNIFPSSSTDIRGRPTSLPCVLLHRNELIHGCCFRQQNRAIDPARNLC